MGLFFGNQKPLIYNLLHHTAVWIAYQPSLRVFGRQLRFGVIFNLLHITAVEIDYPIQHRVSGTLVDACPSL